MKKGTEYRDAVRDVVQVLSKYEATLRDVGIIISALDSEMRIRPVQESAD